MGWTEQIPNLIVIESSVAGFTGFYMYSPAPGKGNLEFQLFVGAHGTDPYGNTVSPGLNMGDWDASGNLLNHFGLDIHGDVFVADSAGVSRLEIEALLGAALWYYPATGKTGGVAAVCAMASDAQTDSVGNKTVPGYLGPVTAADPASTTVLVPETWTTLGSPSATGFTSNIAQYRMTAEGETQIDVKLTAGGSGGTAGTYTYAATLPAPYRPPTTRIYPLGWNSTMVAGAASNALIVNSSGTVQVKLNALAAATIVGTTVRVPLNI